MKKIKNSKLLLTLVWLILLWLKLIETQVQFLTTILSQDRAYLAATSSNDLVFFGGGYSQKTGQPGGQASNRVDIYNVTSGNWTTTTTLSIPRAGLTATSSRNLVFFGGGTDSLSFTNVYDRVDIFNISDGSLISATTTTTTRLSVSRYFLSSSSIGDLVLFGGGFDNSSNPSNVVDIYNVTSNVWNITTLSESRGSLCSTSVGDRYVLFGGGWNGTSYSKIVDIFDLLSGIWNKTTLSEARGDLTSTSLNELAFFGGGNTTLSQTSNIVDIFNSTSLTWKSVTLSKNRTGLASSSSSLSPIGGVVFFGGGVDNSLNDATVDIYIVSNDIWFTSTLSVPCSYLASTSSRNKIFFGGGLGFIGTVNSVTIFDVSSIQPPSTPPPQATTTSSVPSTVPNGMTSPTSTSSISTTTMLTSPSTPFQEDNFSTSLPTSSNDGLSSGAIAGIVVGIVVVLIGVSVIILIVILKERKKKKQQTYSSLTPIGQNINTNNEKDTPTNDLRKSLGPLLTRSQISFNELVVEKEIGEGSYGKVCLGRWNDAPVALKFCRKKTNVDDFVSEIKIMIELPPHPNVVQLFGVSLDGPQPVIIVEYCSGGSLDKLLFGNDENEKPTVSLERKMELIQGIARGVLHLHKHNIIHRDLAARNILLSGSGEPKITDFGMSRILERAEEGKTKSGVGPVCWMAPESLATLTYSKKTDVWTFGIVVYEIVAQCEPHKDADVLETALKIRDQGLTPTIPNDCPPFLRQLMEMCWKKDPDQRPTMEAICAMLSTFRDRGVV